MTERPYATATEARWAVDDAAYADGKQPDADGKQPDPHTYLGGICDEAECYCGIEMPLDDQGKPKLTFEQWIDYHDEVALATLEADRIEGGTDDE